VTAVNFVLRMEFCSEVGVGVDAVTIADVGTDVVWLATVRAEFSSESGVRVVVTLRLFVWTEVWSNSEAGSGGGLKIVAVVTETVSSVVSGAGAEAAVGVFSS
jgi:hypothetical protein